MDQCPPLFEEAPALHMPTHTTNPSRKASNPTRPDIPAPISPPRKTGAASINLPLPPTPFSQILGGSLMLELKKSLQEGTPLQIGWAPEGLKLGTTPLGDTRRTTAEGDGGYISGASSFSILANDSSTERSASLSDSDTDVSDASCVTNPYEKHEEASIDSDRLPCLNYNFGGCFRTRCLLLHKRLSREELLVHTMRRHCKQYRAGWCPRGDTCMFYHPSKGDLDPALLQVETQSSSPVESALERSDEDQGKAYIVKIIKSRKASVRRVRYVSLQVREKMKRANGQYKKKTSASEWQRSDKFFSPTKTELSPDESTKVRVLLPSASLVRRAAEGASLDDSCSHAKPIVCHFCRLGICSNGSHFSAQSAAIPQPMVFQGPQESSAAVSVEKSSSLSKKHSAGPSQCPLSAKPGPSSSAQGKLKTTPAASFIGPTDVDVTLFKSTRVKVGHGFQILDVTTSFESREIILSNLPVDMSGSVIRQITCSFGDVQQVETWSSSGKHRVGRARVVFANEMEASSAINGLNGSKQPFGTITASHFHHSQPREMGRLKAGVISLNIPAPGTTGYLGFETLDEAEAIVKKIHGTTIGRSSIVSAQISYGMPKAGPFTVKFEGLPPASAEKTLRSFSKKIVDGGLLLGDTLYDNLGRATSGLRPILESRGPLVRLEFPPYPPKDGRIRGHAQFASSEAAEAAKQALDGRKFGFVGHERIYVQHEYKMVYKITDSLRSTIGLELGRLASFARSQAGASLIYSPAEVSNTDIVLTAYNVASLKAVKSPLDRLLSGEVLMDGRKPLWDNFFASAGGRALLDRLSAVTRSFVRPNRYRCTIRVWGSGAVISDTKDRISKEIQRLRGTKCFALPLFGKTLMQLLFDGLRSIEEEVGEGNAFIDFSTRRCVIRGTKQQFDWVVHHLSEKYGHLVKPPSELGEAATCPICLDSAVDPIELDCGHCACRKCLSRYVSSAHEHKLLPLRCLGNDNKCTELLPLPMCQRLVPADAFAQVVEASVLAHIQSRPNEFLYCPTPDCPQIYRAGATVSSPQCPTCLVRICASCHSVEHEGVPCAVSAAASDKLFEEWREQNNVKECPKCTSMIEKIAGCNHMMCARCGTHICWACMTTFGESKDVYEHMNKKHGGIGL